MFGNDSKNERGIVELSRRNLLNLVGALGIGGSLSVASERITGQQVDDDVANRRWISMLNEAETVDAKGQQPLGEQRLKMNHSLSLLGVSKDPYGDPFDGDGPSWQLTFVLRASGLGLYRVDSEHPWRPPSLDVGGVRMDNVHFEKNSFSVFATGSESDLLAVSARRDKDLYGYVGGERAKKQLNEKIDENPEIGETLGVDPEENLGNLARMRRRISKREEIENDLWTTITGLASLGLGALSSTAGAAFVILDLVLPWFTDDVENRPTYETKGFRSELRERAPVAGHLVTFDVYVSPKLGDPERRDRTATVEVSTKFAPMISDHRIDDVFDRTWDISISAKGSDLTVKPFARNQDDDSWTQSPIPVIEPDPGGVNILQNQEVTFDASASPYGSHPIANYEWEIEIRRERPGRADQWEQVNEGSGSLITHTFKSDSAYRVRLTLTDEANQTVTLTEEYDVRKLSDIEADFEMTLNLNCRDRQVTSGEDVEQGSPVYLEVTEPIDSTEIEGYRWTVVNEDTGAKLLDERTTDREITWTPKSSGGDYVATVRLTVDFQKGAIRTSKEVIAVEDINEPPRPAFDLTQETDSGEQIPVTDTITPGGGLELDASSSEPCDGTIESYTWEIYTDSRSIPQEREGKTASWPVNVQPGTEVRIVLTVRDDKDATAMVEKTLTVVDPVIDDFEDGDLSKYDYTANGAGIRTDLTYEGTYALDLPARGGSTADGQCVSVSGDIPYPIRGDSFGGYLYQPDSYNQFRFVFAAQGANKDPDGYNVGVSGGRDFVIEVDRRGKELARTSLSGHTDRWLKLVVDWDYEAETDTTTITATLYDKGPDGTENNGILEQIEGSESPSTYESGGLAYNADARGSSMAFDNVRFF